MTGRTERALTYFVRIWTDRDLGGAPYEEHVITEPHAAAVSLMETRRAEALFATGAPATGEVVLALSEKCGVFWNDNTAPGWVEIQRDDAYAAGVGGKGTEFHDEDAARLVCREAGVPESCAVWLSIEAWRDGGTEVHIHAIDDPKRAEGDWTACVPAVVAYLAGLLDDEQLAKANAEGT